MTNQRMKWTVLGGAFLLGCLAVAVTTQAETGIAPRIVLDTVHVGHKAYIKSSQIRYIEVEEGIHIIPDRITGSLMDSSENRTKLCIPLDLTISTAIDGFVYLTDGPGQHAWIRREHVVVASTNTDGNLFVNTDISGGVIVLDTPENRATLGLPPR